MHFDLKSEDLRQLDPTERLPLLKDALSKIQADLHEKHLRGQRGIHHARERSAMLDELLSLLFKVTSPEAGAPEELALVANGGYGREHMNPGSDIDLLFLVKDSSHRIPEEASEMIQAIQMVIWDLGFKFLPSTRSLPECIKEARSEPQSRTALLDARLIVGDPLLFETFRYRFRKDCIIKDQAAFFEERRREISSRHSKWSYTVFLQEPNVKESPGGLRDHHNLEWIIDAEAGTRSMTELIEQKILTPMARRELKDAFDFLHRVRNSLHYHDKGNDILTLRLQGVVADEFGYPQKTILRRIESFMRDYYTHTRNIRNHTKSVFEIFEIQHDEENSNKRGMFGFLRKTDDELIELTDYTILNDRLSAKREDLFTENPTRLIRLFLYCQRHGARPAPELRKLIKTHWHLIDKEFRYSEENRDSFREILEHKGQTARILRLMHRSGVLGRYLPEFGALDCLVQHEFFHRYTADEHTLRCIDQLDALVDDDNLGRSVYRDIFLKHPDPYALYLSLILHDAGRAKNVREHIDGSAILAAELCKRMKVTGGRRALIMFLVDHHLTLWRFATKKNIDDPEVIEEFASLMGDRHRLDALLLFTFADSNGTNEEAWSPWKETLILQLYRNAREFLIDENTSLVPKAPPELDEVLSELKGELEEKYHAIIDEHFDLMPRRYFRYRTQRSLRKHILALWQYIDRRQRRPDTPFECAVQWVEHPKFGYTEFIVAAHDNPRLLEKICCVLASRQISILSSDVYTRPDGIVLDLFRVCTDEMAAVESRSLQLDVVAGLYKINEQENYDPEEWLKKKVNFLKPETEQIIQFPVRAWVSNDLDPHLTVIEIQALDRIGLLHDVYRCVNDHDLRIVHARICTEKGAALDSIYVLTQDGKKLEDPEKMQALQDDVRELVD